MHGPKEDRLSKMVVPMVVGISLSKLHKSVTKPHRIGLSYRPYLPIQLFPYTMDELVPRFTLAR